MIVKGNKVLLSVSISVELASEVKEIAKRSKRSVSSIIEEALAEYLGHQDLEKEGEEEEEEAGQLEAVAGVPANVLVVEYRCRECGKTFKVEGKADREKELKADKCEFCGSKNLEIIDKYFTTP